MIVFIEQINELQKLKSCEEIRPRENHTGIRRMKTGECVCEGISSLVVH